MLRIYRAIRLAWHVAAKIFAFGCFGLGSLTLAFTVIPALWLFVHPRARFRRVVRAVVRGSFASFVVLMRGLRLIAVYTDDRARLARARRAIICANHPSLIDVVILTALVPRADCIVKARLWKNPFMMNIVRSVYIPNSLDPEETFRACRRTLEEGNNLIIFPEGTRTANHGDIRLQRNAAHIALRTGRPILPVRIKADSPRGLQKGDSVFDTPASGLVRFWLEVRPPLDPSEYAGIPEPRAARMLTNKLKEAILGAAKSQPDG
ncbi:MAG: 1-acyl-sn-glycerol-3-phosphate acyltransferase [Spirochaetales bacterium]|nr:1-acyl-sn-glycerol-3-phosphate acyltransferase [Spirochaetales bacterium]